MLAPELDLALSRCLGCIVDRSAWPAAMHSLAEALGADAACLFAERAPELRLRLPASPAYGAFLRDFTKGEWSLTDHRAQRGWPLLRGGGRVLVEHDLVSDDERRALPVYHELYAKHDLTWWAAVSFRVDQRDWAMPLLRREQKGPFVDAQGLSALAPHLARIVALWGDMVASQARTSVELLAACRRAAVVLDTSGRCLAINASAEAMLGQEVSIVGGRLVATNTSIDRRLQGLVTGAISARSSAELPEPIIVSRRDQLPLVIDAVAGANSMGQLDLGFQAILVLTDLDKADTGDPARLRQIFAFTPAEARLAADLSTGGTLSEASQNMGLAKETARTQLKAIFAKTGVNRQADLVRLLDRALGAGRK